MKGIHGIVNDLICRHAEIVKMLIDAGSSVNVRPPTGTPLYLAAQNGYSSGFYEIMKKAHKSCGSIIES